MADDLPPIGKRKPPFLELDQFWRGSGETYCFRPTCEGCRWDPTCERENTLVPVGPGLNIRRAFRSAPGYQIVSIDYKGIELRVAGQLSGEQVFIKAFREGRDLHQEMAKLAFKTPTPTKEQRRQAKCIAGDHRVLTTQGAIQIQQLPESPTDLLTEFGKKSTGGMVPRGKQPTLHLKTRYGRGMRVTAQHQLKVWSVETGSIVWKQAQDLQAGDRLLRRAGDGGLIPENRGRSPQYWEVLGHLFGDGSARLSRREMVWVFDRSEPERRDLIKQILQSLGPKLYEWSTGGIDFIQAQDWADGLIQIDPDTKDWKSCGAPQELWSAGKSQMRAFLRGLFSTDGWAGKHPRFKTSRQTLAEDVQEILLYLGILSRVSYRKQNTNFKDGAEEWVVTVVTKEGVRQYVDQVGFSHHRKQAIQGTGEKSGHDRFWGIPQPQVLVKRIIGEGYKSYRNLPTGKLRTTLQSVDGGYTQTLTLPTVNSLIHWAQDHDHDSDALDLLRDFRQYQWFFDPLETLTPAGEVAVYDILDSQVLSYTSNGYTNHNCANFGNLFLGTPHTLARQSDLTLPEASYVWEAWWKALPDYRGWTESQYKLAKDQQKVWTFFGRERQMAAMIKEAIAQEEGTSKKKKQGKSGWAFVKRTAVNSPVQGTAADLMKIAMINVRRWLFKEKLQDTIRLLLTVHDELVFEIKDDNDLYTHSRAVAAEMCPDLSSYGWIVPVETDIEIGPNWAELTGIDKLSPLPKSEDHLQPDKPKTPPDGVVLVVNTLLNEYSRALLDSAIVRAMNCEETVKVPLKLKIAGRTYRSGSPGQPRIKVNEALLCSLVANIPGVEIEEIYN